jgi:hypothetical protein
MGRAGLQHVLGLEVRAGAVGAGDGGGDAGFALHRQGVDALQLRVQAEGGVQLQHLVGLHGDRAAQVGVVGVTDRRRDGQAVHAAPADDDDQLLPGEIALGGREGLRAEEVDGDAQAGAQAEQ